MIEFVNCDVIINGTGLVANSATISEQNSLKPAYGIGFNRHGYVVDGPKTCEIQINYILNPLSETNVKIIRDLKSNPPILNPVNIEVAGLRVSGYLTNFSISLDPNDKVNASASYTSFHDIVGDISEKRGTVYYESNPINFAHGWSSVVGYNSSSLSKTYSLSYECSLEYKPYYSIGSKFPSQVLFLGGSENLQIVKDDYIKINFSGHSGAYELFSTTGESVLLYNLNKELGDSSSAISIDMRDSTLTSSRLNARVDDYVKTEITAQREF